MRRLGSEDAGVFVNYRIPCPSCTLQGREERAAALQAPLPGTEHEDTDACSSGPTTTKCAQQLHTVPMLIVTPWVGRDLTPENRGTCLADPPTLPSRIPSSTVYSPLLASPQ